jgi:methylated-DNA-[protein]-cysteine S-methyltransferase
MMTSITMDTPVGPLVIASDDGAITHVLFHDGPVDDTPTDKLPPVLVEAKRQLEAYFAGDLKEFSLPLAAEGTDFQRRVWAELEQIPYGVTASYGEVAKALGMPPGASRAVGLANGANPIAIVVPCHRVIGANGTLTGYAGGLERKKYLLDLESRDLQPELFDDPVP